MYLAQLERDAQDWLSAVVRITHPPAGSARLSEDWRHTLDAAARAVDMVPVAASALRVVLSPDGTVNTSVFAFASASVEAEAALRRWLGVFTRLELIAPGTVSLPTSREQYDQYCEDFPSLRCRISAAPDRFRGTWLACDFRLRPNLGQLLIDAQSLGFGLAYQWNFCPFRVTADTVRLARRNLLALEQMAGAPDILREHQRMVVDQLSTIGGIAEEFVAADPGDPSRWLTSALRQRFVSSHGKLGFRSPDFELEDGIHDEAIARGLHTFLSEEQWPDVEEVCGTGVDLAVCADGLAWVPPDGLARRGHVDPTWGDEASALVPEGLPAPRQKGRDHLFISYRRADLPRLAGLFSAVSSAQVPVWYDRGIPGGTEWDAVIEERIETCLAVVVFVSPAAVASKYVRREIKFADAIDKRIIAVVVEPAQLTDGLGMLLGQYQSIDGRTEDVTAKLRYALEDLVGTRPRSGSRDGRAPGVPRGPVSAQLHNSGVTVYCAECGAALAGQERVCPSCGAGQEWP